MFSFQFDVDGRANPASLPFEIVERKGLGHPDTLADAIAEDTSRRYALYCKERYGAVAHHWFDKVMLIGGEADTGFLKGRMIRPVRAILVGKAALTVGGEEIPLLRHFKEAVSNVFAGVLKNFSFEDYCVCELQVNDSVGPGQRSIRYRPKSPNELKQFESGGLVSNDCNICVGFAPYTPTELLTLELEAFLLSPPQQAKRPWIGADIKTVTTRIDTRTEVLSNIPMLASYVDSFETYAGMRDTLQADLRDFCRQQLSADCTVTVNPEWIHGRAYLTASGTCLDTGDIGVVGRGNRHSGLITPMRSMSIEGTAGKNPLDHTGKLFNVAATQIAQRVYSELGMASTVYISAKKGDRLEAPTFVAIHCDRCANIASRCEMEALRIATNVLANIDSIRASLLAGTTRLF